MCRSSTPFSPTLLNSARIGYSRGSYFFTGIVPATGVTGWMSGEPVGAIVISGSTASNGASAITGAGANTGSNNRTARNLFTEDDHIYWSRGRNQIEAGAWLQRVQSNDLLAQDSIRAGLRPATETTFPQGTVATFTLVPAPTELGWRSYEGSGLLDDTIKLTPRLELRAGFRLQSRPTDGMRHRTRVTITLSTAFCRPRRLWATRRCRPTAPNFLARAARGLGVDVWGNGKTGARRLRRLL